MAVGFSHNMMYREFLAKCQKQRVGTVIPSAYAIVYNQAQEEVVTNHLKVMEFNKETYDALLPLKRVVSNAVFTVAPDSYAYNIGTYNIVEPVRRILKVSVKLNGTGSPVKCILVKANESTDILNGVFSRPSFHQCYYSKGPTSERDITVFIPATTLTIMGYIEYYVEPTLVTATDVISPTLESMFNKEVCDDIIKTAARMYIERVQDSRYQTYMNEIKQS